MPGGPFFPLVSNRRSWHFWVDRLSGWLLSFRLSELVGFAAAERSERVSAEFCALLDIGVGKR